MPLRDHFRPPLLSRTSWEGFHATWPTVIVMALNKFLPPNYVAEPRVHLGAFYEIDVGALEHDEPKRSGSASDAGHSGVATAVWAPPEPTLAVATELPDQYEYEVRVYDMQGERRQVAAIEFVSQANKDRSENRHVFVAKCAELLRQQVSVAIVDLVTLRQFNLYNDLLELIGQTDPAASPKPPALYAAACRWRRVGIPPRDFPWLETWAHTLTIGQSLPTLPLWLSETLAVPLELEASYEETCRVLRIV
jgi:hypothetical protein